MTASHGTFCWNELATSDVVKGATFYAELLGWTIQTVPMGEMGSYTLFKKDGKDVGGAMQITEDWGDVPPHWMAYVSVDDVDASAQRVTELGGQIIHPPMDISVGRFCIIKDPQGAVVSLITLKDMTNETVPSGEEAIEA